MPVDQSKVKSIIQRAQQHPNWWINRILGDVLWHKQVEILESVRDNQETAVASCHGAGKSFTAARLALAYLCSHKPSIVITTAPTDRQVKGILWKEIRLAHQRARMPIGGKLLTQELKLDTNWWAWGFTAPDRDPDRFQGWHETHILVIVDEACGVSENIYEAIDGVLTSEHARLLMIGNPTDASGRFGKAFKTAGVKKIRISAYDTPNFTTFGITEEDVRLGNWQDKIAGASLPAPYLVTPQWVATRYQRWGPTSSLYQARVLGQFPEQGSDTLIPLAWIEAAQARQLKPGAPIQLGVDVARYGEDETVLYLRRGSVVRMHGSHAMSTTMETVGWTVHAMDETDAEIAKVDADGIGAGVYDRLVELGRSVYEIRGGMTASDPERFANRRAEWYWGLRERFETGDIDIPEDDDELASQLANLKWKVNSRGQIIIESKDEMKKRGLSSPDRADGVCYAFATPTDAEDGFRLL